MDYKEKYEKALDMTNKPKTPAQAISLYKKMREERNRILRPLMKRCAVCGPKVIFNERTCVIRYDCQNCLFKQITDNQIEQLFKTISYGL